MLLNVHSNYSLQYGTIPVQELVNELILNGYQAAVLTDINNTSAVLDFIHECQQKHFTGLAGAEFRNADTLLFVAIARNNEGFREINEYLTEYNQQKKPFPSAAPEWDHVYVIYPLRSTHEGLRDNEYLGLRPGQINKLYGKPRAFIERLVIWSPVTVKERNDFDLHRQLVAIKHNALIDHLKAEQQAASDEVLRPLQELISFYSAYPKIIYNTDHLISNCSFDFDFTTCKNKRTFTNSQYTDKLLLEKYALEGWADRYGTGNKEALRRVKHELEVIDRLGFSSYFLITHDVVRYAMWRGYYHVGRGSGANSIVAYCMRITDVCPIELDLYFERFLNPKRNAPPDFDLDFSWRERDEIFDYMFKRYDPKHTALLGMMTTFQDRSIIRELGKIYGLPKRDIDQMIASPKEIRADNHIALKILQVYDRISDFPHNRSIHAGGVLISELPIAYYSALDLPPKGLLTTQFDMYTASTIGFEKVDILSQRGIGHIRDAVDIIRENCGKTIDVHQVAKIKNDPKVNEQLKAGNTIGNFYIESPSMISVNRKLGCNNYLTLVASSSIIRPGVGSSGMMDEYIKRYHQPEKVVYLHPVLEEQLKETYGVMVYQEDVLKVAHHYAGLDLADADVLRRLMSGKNRGAHHLSEIQEKFFRQSKELGRPDETTAELWRQISSFAGYSFSKAHSASYAVESYQSLYLKTYYPKEFMVAVINNDGGFYQKWVYVAEARKAGANVHLPCVNNSRVDAMIRGNDIYLGLGLIQGLETTVMQNILNVRSKDGNYLTMEDLIERTGISLEQTLLLVRSGALRFTGQNKKTLMWLANMVFEKRSKVKKLLPGSRPLLRPETVAITLPEFDCYGEEDFFDEMEFLHFSLSLSPFTMLKTNFRGHLKAKQLIEHVGQVVKMVGLYVTAKPTRTKKGDAMAFGSFLDIDGDFFDTVHFPASLAKYPFQKGGLYLILGKITESFGVPSITVEKMAMLPIRLDPRFS
ncbi:DNA polymerase III subunit alpha [Mucilaginibacter sp. SJ]|uniref:DNA polymerase III subunit alpha n=1 Tax=Mucilaginibacter sp. SJ TaxID=3029053 RepID=UPI0023A950F8|nr:DNA polymerase III subunit alpha [Mucilaginibacter sp. SJ]WEA01706.1 DNA polymerase III subunit alpha [Mucilaginibacter sp. SJ]